MATAVDFSYMRCMGSAANSDAGIDLVLEHRPDFIFLEINPKEQESGLSLHFISELHRYLLQLPKIIITTKDHAQCPTAFQFGVFDYLIHPIAVKDLRKTLLRFEKEIGEGQPIKNQMVPPNNINHVADEARTILVDNDSPEPIQVQSELPEEATHLPENNELAKTLDESSEKNTTQRIAEQPIQKPLVICVKSYGDYRYIDAAEICYLQADNNSTDIHLNSGEMITAFKTLKHFESVLQHPFVRIHNSYIVNCNYIARIHTGNSVCHIKNSSVKIPFSKSYKDNIEQIISSIASGNYLEI